MVAGKFSVTVTDSSNTFIESSIPNREFIDVG